MSQHPPSQDPYGQQDPYAAQQGYSQPMHYPGYPQYPQQPRKPLDFAKIVFIGAWVVLGLYSLHFFYILTQDEPPLGTDDFADRLFGQMTTLAEGFFYTGALLAVSVWLDRQQKQKQAEGS